MSAGKVVLVQKKAESKFFFGTIFQCFKKFYKDFFDMRNYILKRLFVPNCSKFCRLQCYLKCWIIQKQPPRGVPSKRCSENVQQIYRRTPMPTTLLYYWNLQYTLDWFSPGAKSIADFHPLISISQVIENDKKCIFTKIVGMYFCYK